MAGYGMRDQTWKYRLVDGCGSNVGIGYNTTQKAIKTLCGYKNEESEINDNVKC